jgi:hypothetical protein
MCPKIASASFCDESEAHTINEIVSVNRLKVHFLLRVPFVFSRGFKCFILNLKALSLGDTGKGRGSSQERKEHDERAAHCSASACAGSGGNVGNLSCHTSRRTPRRL